MYTPPIELQIHFDSAPPTKRAILDFIYSETGFRFLVRSTECLYMRSIPWKSYHIKQRSNRLVIRNQAGILDIPMVLFAIACEKLDGKITSEHDISLSNYKWRRYGKFEIAKYVFKKYMTSLFFVVASLPIPTALILIFGYGVYYIASKLINNG